jgi:hypothetical protein
MHSDSYVDVLQPGWVLLLSAARDHILVHLAIVLRAQSNPGSSTSGLEQVAPQGHMHLADAGELYPSRRCKRNSVPALLDTLLAMRRYNSGDQLTRYSGHGQQAQD